VQQWVIQWYGSLSVLNAAVAGPLRDLADGIGWAPLSALIFGLIGTTAPCQLTTNAAALAYVARSSGDRAATARSAFAYLLGKVLVYSLIGLGVILAGRQLAVSAIPIVVVARKVLGPLMILLGLYLLGALPLHFSVGGPISNWIEDRAGAGWSGAFLLGTAFSFAFCPTLFLLFFGLMIPLALVSPTGVAFPAIFAVGTALPLIGLATVLTLGRGATDYVRGARRVDRWIRPAAAVVLVLAGLHDTVVYWLL
jgi:cytochrome c-type biogenesis protein